VSAQLISTTFCLLFLLVAARLLVGRSKKAAEEATAASCDAASGARHKRWDEK